ncbi:MAG: hypothetical protein J6X95_03675, partial [Treponema sp.]|nr:hypothetical protein [Treponema sp.]
ELSHFPSFVLEMDCLPLIEPEPEPEPASSPPVIKSWNSVWQGESRDGTEGNMSVTVYWLDDFGHKEVSVAAGANPEGKDLASLVERDGWGREIKDWLPVVSLDSLTIVHPGADSVKTLAGVTYGNSEKPYSLTEYEQSALSRVTGQFGPGAAWQNSGKKVSTAYLTNTASGAELSCRRFVCTSSNWRLISLWASSSLMPSQQWSLLKLRHAHSLPRSLIPRSQFRQRSSKIFFSASFMFQSSFRKRGNISILNWNSALSARENHLLQKFPQQKRICSIFLSRFPACCPCQCLCLSAKSNLSFRITRNFSFIPPFLLFQFFITFVSPQLVIFIIRKFNFIAANMTMIYQFSYQMKFRSDF